MCIHSAGWYRVYYLWLSPKRKRRLSKIGISSNLSNRTSWYRRYTFCISCVSHINRSREFLLRKVYNSISFTRFMSSILRDVLFQSRIFDQLRRIFTSCPFDLRSIAWSCRRIFEHFVAINVTRIVGIIVAAILSEICTKNIYLESVQLIIS